MTEGQFVLGDSEGDVSYLWNLDLLRGEIMFTGPEGEYQGRFSFDLPSSLRGADALQIVVYLDAALASLPPRGDCPNCRRFSQN